MQTVGLWGSFAIIAFFPACGDDSTVAADAGHRSDAGSDAGSPAQDGGTDAGGSDAGTGGGASVTFEVVEGLSAMAMPATGAQVAFDAPGGRRMEATTDATGSVRFDGIDWSAGRAAVTFYREGSVVVSFVELTETVTAEVASAPIRMNPIEVAPSVRVDGTTMHMMDDTHNLNVLPQCGTDFDVFNARGPAFRVTVRSGEPCTLLGLEYTYDPMAGARVVDQSLLAWSTVAVPASSAPATAQIDFAENVLTPQTATGSFPLPAAMTSRLRTDSIGYLLLATLHDGTLMGFHGFPTHIAPSADGSRMDYTAAWVTLPGERAEDQITGYLARVDREQSIAWRRGYPGTGMQSITLLELPTVVSPPRGGMLLWHDDVEVRVSDTDYEGVGLGLSRADGRLLWFVNAPAGVTRFAAPRLPSGVDEHAVLGTDTLDGQVNVCAGFRSIFAAGCDRGSFARAFAVMP